MNNKTPVRNRLGHPCKMHEADERFGDAIKAALSSGEDAHLLKQKLAEELMVLQDRIDHLHNALQARPDFEDPDQVASFLQIVSEYQLSTSRQMWDFAGRAMVALKKVDEVQRS